MKWKDDSEHILSRNNISFYFILFYRTKLVKSEKVDYKFNSLKTLSWWVHSQVPILVLPKGKKKKVKINIDYSQKGLQYIYLWRFDKVVFSFLFQGSQYNESKISINSTLSYFYKNKKNKNVASF